MNELSEATCVKNLMFLKSFMFDRSTRRLSPPRASFWKETGLHFHIVNPKSIKFPDFSRRTYLYLRVVG